MADETRNLISDAGMRLDLAERRLLAGMPLHAITSAHGEAGRRERLATEIAGFPAADRDRARDALALASRPTGGRTNPTPATCSGSRSGSRATTAPPTRT